MRKQRQVLCILFSQNRVRGVLERSLLVATTISSVAGMAAMRYRGSAWLVWLLSIGLLSPWSTIRLVVTAALSARRSILSRRRGILLLVSRRGRVLGMAARRRRAIVGLVVLSSRGSSVARLVLSCRRAISLLMTARRGSSVALLVGRSAVARLLRRVSTSSVLCRVLVVRSAVWASGRTMRVRLAAVWLVSVCLATRGGSAWRRWRVGVVMAR